MKQMHTIDCADGLGIGDVSRICGVPIHTIRYWEKEFKDFLQPPRTTGKQRRYRDDDMAKILQIRKMVWDHKFSIKAAKRILTASAHTDTYSVFQPTGILSRFSQFVDNSYIPAESAA